MQNRPELGRVIRDGDQVIKYKECKTCAGSGLLLENPFAQWGNTWRQCVPCEEAKKLFDESPQAFAEQYGYTGSVSCGGEE